jgi:L-alanine-DL-glutamate epimerase-like enolase superfamily enzyme
VRISAARSRRVRVPLSRPYAIAAGGIEAAELVVLELATDAGAVGYGHAAPAPAVTGETAAAAAQELAPERCAWLLGRAAAEVALLLGELDAHVAGPAAHAAVDAALHDLWGKRVGLPLVEVLGGVRRGLPTSITIGVKPADATLAEAAEYVARGFTVLKVKVGLDVDEDVRRLERLRARFGPALVLRADANQGYDLAALMAFAPAMDALGIELLEQPCRPADDDGLRALPAALRRRLVADESVRDAADLRRLGGAGAFGGINVKLMKCGGIAPALELARAAERAGLGVMWGCNDESAVGIAAALHAALASSATRWIDLDGSFDLAADPFTGGFTVEGGVMTPLDRPGLGVVPARG